LRACCRHLVEELANRPAQGILIKIARARDVEARGAQGLGDEPGIVAAVGSRPALYSLLPITSAKRRSGACGVDWRGEQRRQHGQQGRYP